VSRLLLKQLILLQRPFTKYTNFLLQYHSARPSGIAPASYSEDPGTETGYPG